MTSSICTGSFLASLLLHLAICSFSWQSVHSYAFENHGSGRRALWGNWGTWIWGLFDSDTSITTVYYIADGMCGEYDIEADYVVYAQLFADVEEGSCSDNGYQVYSGIDVVEVYYIGEIEITIYVQTEADIRDDDLEITFGTTRVDDVVELQLQTCGSGCVEVLFVDQQDLEIGGYQFDVTGAAITGAHGGLSENFDFSISSSDSVVIGFSFAGDVIHCEDTDMNDNGACVLVELSLDGDAGAEFCVENQILSDAHGNQLGSNEVECVYLPECQDDADVNADGSVDIMDIVTMVNQVLDSSWDESSCEFIAGDVTGDGSLDILDIVSVVNIILYE